MSDIVINFDELSQHGGHGEQAAQITVTREDGQIQRFFITLYAKSNGGVACQVSAVRMRLPQDTKKSVVGSWFSRRP